MNYHCAKLCTNISTHMDTTNIFLFLAMFFNGILSILPPPPPQIAYFLPIQLGIISNIVS